MTIVNKVSLKSVNAGNTAIPDVPDAPTIGAVTDAGDGTTATVAYTAAATGGAVTTFTATSNPGSFTGTGSSPISVTGLTAGTAYTFKVKGTNATATGPESSASGSLTLATPPAFVSLATTTVGAGGSATITFNSIPQTYTHLQIRGVAKAAYSSTSVGASQFKIQFNGDTSANYSMHQIYGNGTSAGSNNSTSTSQANGNAAWALAGGLGGNLYIPIILDILDYSSSTKNKTLRILEGLECNSTSTNQYISLRSHGWFSTSAITSILLDSNTPYADGIFSQNTTFALYGIKG